MRTKTATIALAVYALCIGFGQPAASQITRRDSEEVLTNASVVKLVRAGFSEKAVIAIIRVQPTKFDLSPSKLIELKKSRVPEKIILAMLAREQTVALASEDWEDDAFFNDDGKWKGSSGGSGSQSDGGRDIFGSSGGTKGRTKSRDGSGGVDTDSQTVGSATVRILRPPAEAGGASEAKLERTPTLKNDSVVELVEAGFSEGTIIRRIENSPVEFDLSPEKLAELRKRRVTEPVIAAMMSAMGDEK